MGKLTSLALSPDASLVFVGMGPTQYKTLEPEGTPTLRCFSTSTGRDVCPQITQGMADLYITALCVSSDGKMLACICNTRLQVRMTKQPSCYRR